MTSSVTLFDNGKTRLSLRAHDPKASVLVITFNVMHSNDVDGPGAGEDFLFDEGFDVVSVKPRSNLWFQDLSQHDLAAAIAPLGYEEVLTYGSSMGGYAAAYFAGAVGAVRAVLFSPQFSIHPDVSPWDLRWKDYWSLPFSHAPIARAEDADTRYVILYDPWTPDGRHAELISAAVGEANVTHVRVPFSGHETVATLREAGVLSKLVLAYLRDPSQAPAYVSALRRGRKATWSQAYHLYFRALSQRRRVANRDLAAEVLRRANRDEYRVHSVEPFLAISHWVDAAAVMRAIGTVRLKDDILVHGAISSVDHSLRLIEDPPIRAWLMPLWAEVTGRKGAFDAECALPPAPPLIQRVDSGLLPLVDEGAARGLAGLSDRLGAFLKRGLRRGA